MELNFNNWTYSDFAMAFNYFRDGNSEALNGLLTKATGTDFDSMPLTKAAKSTYDAIMGMNKFVEGLDFTTCRVDFDAANWDSKAYRRFQKAMNSRNIEEVEKLVREVAFMEDVDNASDAPLTARQGCTMVRAITQKYQDILSGKS